MTIDEPGVYRDIPEDEYHADPVKGRSLSQSGAKTLLTNPQRFKWQRENPPPKPKPSMNLGSAVHKVLLGAGPELVEIDADNYNRKQHQEERDEAFAAGNIPVLPKERDLVNGMVNAVRDDPTAGPLFTKGRPEQILVWDDPTTGVRCRGMLDWLPDPGDGPASAIPDLKTAVSAAPREFASSAAKFKYHIQAPWYLNGARALGYADEFTAFLFVVVETKPPHPVEVYELEWDDMELGDALGAKARRLYAEYTALDFWPSYTGGKGVHRLNLPRWAHYEL